MDKQKDSLIDGWMAYIGMDGWVDGWLLDGYMGRWMADGLVDGLPNGYVDG